MFPLLTLGAAFHVHFVFVALLASNLAQWEENANALRPSEKSREKAERLSVALMPKMPKVQ